MTLWEGRFSSKLNPDAWKYNASLDIDKRMASQDVQGSIAWANAIHKAGVIAAKEHSQIVAGLNTIQQEFSNNTFEFAENDEDIHTAVERRLSELIGQAAGKLHTGRSRNDQVATDFRMWMMEAVSAVDSAITELQKVLVGRAEIDLAVVMPGYTHMQRAQPILLSHWWLSFFWPLQRDRERLSNLNSRTSVLPLGCGALAGTPFPIDREELVMALNFSAAAPNSLDAVSDRDFAAEFLFCASLLGVHISRLAEAAIIFCTAEFGFFELPDSYATGSSLMPQKKNPDVFELARGKAGTLIGNLTGFLATLKSLPSTYDKDLQEDKNQVFSSFDILMSALPVISGALRSLKINAERMRSAVDAGMLATDLADEFVKRGLPFRQAHHLVGKAVKFAISKGISLDEVSLDELRALNPDNPDLLSDDISTVFDPEHSISRRSAAGGTAPEAVASQLSQAKSMLLKE
ncbi:MAG: argininosuccinate lyase [Chloroflexi bacterium]|nr:MAG: argininosuccinate lyase [Chloroflexota bacterium]